MVLWLVKWKLTQQYMSLPIEEQRKVNEKRIEISRTDRDVGKMKPLGRLVNGDEGYYTSEHSETEIFEYFLKVRPYMSFEAIPLIPTEQANEIVRKVKASETM